jgi:hypothetical protein
MCAALLVLLLGVSALAIDMGNLYWSYQELLSATQSAAKAGGGAMANPNVTSAQDVAYQYSGDTSPVSSSDPTVGQYNIHPNLTMTGVTVSFTCVTGSAVSNMSMPSCIKYPNACPSAICNAIQVTETATVSTFIAKIFGVTKLNISATAAASAGGVGNPYHIVVALDSTNSMGSGTDSSCTDATGTTGYSPEECAKLGVQSLLSELEPCANLANCTNSSTPIDEVALMSFPGLSGLGSPIVDPPVASSSASDDYECNVKNSPSTASYNNDPGYLIVGFANGNSAAINEPYRNSSGLVTSSTLVEALSASKGCGLQTPGGQGTFYAGALVAAQQYLTYYHTKGIQDVIIFLSDGNAGNGNMNGSIGQTATGSPTLASQITTLTKNDTFAATGQCAQAVEAASWVKAQKQSADGMSTEIYSVAYGSEGTGCTDAGENKLTPCTTMEGIASTPVAQYFFSVVQNGNQFCGAEPLDGMTDVFNYIGGQLSGSRLIPNSVFTAGK